MSEGEEESEGRSPIVWIAIAVAAFFVLIPIVVIFAAVIASFVLGLGSAPVDTTPSASFSMAVNDSAVVLTMESGELMDANRLYVRLDGQRVGNWATLGGHDQVQAGDSVRVEGVQSDQQVSIVWDDGETTTTMFEDTTVSTFRLASSSVRAPS